jgi:hypothetical protein
MEDTVKMFESLFERVVDYSKTSYELAKLKTLDKASDVVSSFVPHAIALILLATFMLFLNLGIALWIGDILENAFYGFFIIAGFYLLIGLIVHFFLNKWLKKRIYNYIIKLMLK